MNKITISLIFIGSLMFSQAQSPSNDSINDFNKFFSVKLGLNLINSIGEHEPFAFLNDFDEMAFNNNPNAELEYRFSRAFSLGLMVSINTWEANKGNIDGIIVNEDTHYFAADLDLKYYFSQEFKWFKRHKWLELYLHAGPGFVSKEDNSDISLNFGPGANFWFTDNFGLNISGTGKWLSDHGNAKHNTNHFQYSTALVYRFKDNDHDNDGIKNNVDDCPYVAGVALNNGCPEENYDRDGDGVTDAIDNCPDVYGTNYSGCPEKTIEVDTDGDSVFDSIDKCPKIKGLPSNMGCPLPDSDNDGVVDVSDACPNIPGVNTNNGCPFESVELFKLLTNHIYFNLDYYTFSPESEEILKKVIDFSKSYPNTKFVLLGHTDSLGSEKSNILLSQKRVDEVYSYLVKNGLMPGNLSTKALGETQPLASNSTKNGRRLNRRVEIKIIK